jgi:D-alanyl-D-alanine dipeptidase
MAPQMSMKKEFLIVITALLLFSCQKQKSPAPEYDNSDFVRVTDVIPDAILEIRYYSTYNFVGERIDGYEQPIALMTREAADSLIPNGGISRCAMSLTRIRILISLYNKIY